MPCRFVMQQIKKNIDKKKRKHFLTLTTFFNVTLVNEESLAHPDKQHNSGHEYLKT